MGSSLLAEILEWSIDRPLWQRDAMRRLFLNGEFENSDVLQLVEIVKAAHGLAEGSPIEPLAGEHLAISGPSTGPISLVSLTHHDGVNALAPNQTVRFTPALTIVFGNNAAGKSGYTRILKQACRSRYSEKVIGNVLTTAAPVTPHATIMFRDGGSDEFFSWSPKATPSEKLPAVSIFDSQCVPVYLRDKTDVAFRPFGLDVFDKLSTVCLEIRGILEKERSLLNSSAPSLPIIPDGTAARKLLNGLTSLTSADAVRGVAILGENDEARLAELQRLRHDFESDNPKKLARDLALRADRFETLARHVNSIAETFATASLRALPPLRSTAIAARARLDALRDSMMTAELLPGSGGAEWTRMWDSAGNYSAVAYPGEDFPPVEEAKQCVLCQRELLAEGVARFARFKDYVTSTAQAEASAAELAADTAINVLLTFAVDSEGVATAREELLLEDAEAAAEVTRVVEAAQRTQKALDAWSKGLGEAPVVGVQVASTELLLRIAAGLSSRAKELLSSSAGMTPEMERELNELEARQKLGEHLPLVLDAIERKKRIAAYALCLDDVATNAITKKSTELTKRLVTDTLRQTFESELKAIAFTHLDVEVQPAGGSKGSLYHRLVFTHAPSIQVTNVLSEGEGRALSVAAFMTELSTASSKSTIVFDDPVSSLDHVWRERIARRLVSEAKTRQVIVFTHDLLFLHYLIAQSEQQDVALGHQYIRRQGEAGFCLPDLPWVAMSIKERVGVLKKRAQDADKTFRRDPDNYESDAREIYGLLREAWEQAVAEVLLNSVVERYRPSIETNRVRKLYDITQDDCETLEREMTECSRWIRGHDASPADGTPIPEPKEMQERVQALEAWVAGIRKRR